MANFYISEILELGGQLNQLTSNEEQLQYIQQLVRQHIGDKQQVDQQFRQLNWQWYNSQLASFKIELARTIIAESQFATLQKQQVRLLVLLNIETAGIPAQNALLKLIEEPPADTLVILPVSQASLLLDTIQSRCLLIDYQNQFQLILDSQTAGSNTSIPWPKDVKTAFELIRQYRQRPAAQQLVWQLLQNPELNYRQKQALNQAHLDLKRNHNVRLALEHCFLSVPSEWPFFSDCNFSRSTANWLAATSFHQIT